MLQPQVLQSCCKEGAYCAKHIAVPIQIVLQVPMIVAHSGTSSQSQGGAPWSQTSDLLATPALGSGPYQTRTPQVKLSRLAIASQPDNAHEPDWQQDEVGLLSASLHSLLLCMGDLRCVCG